MSLAYANADGPKEAFEAALDGFTDVATVTVGAIDLIRFGRDRQMYEWETIARLPLGGTPTACPPKALAEPTLEALLRGPGWNPTAARQATERARSGW